MKQLMQRCEQTELAHKLCEKNCEHLEAVVAAIRNS